MRLRRPAHRSEVVFIPFCGSLAWGKMFNTLLASVFANPIPTPRYKDWHWSRWGLRREIANRLQKNPRGAKGVFYGDITWDFTVDLHVSNGLHTYWGFVHRAANAHVDPAWQRLHEYERGILRCAEDIFVSTEGSNRLLDIEGKSVGLPLFYKPRRPDGRSDTILFNHRISEEKGSKSLKGLAERLPNRVVVSTPVVPPSMNWVTGSPWRRFLYEPPLNEYHAELNAARYVVSYDRGETFGYAVMEALMAGAFPICPNDPNASFPYLFPPEMLYERDAEVPERIEFWDSRPDERDRLIRDTQERIWGMFQKDAWVERLLKEMKVEA